MTISCYKIQAKLITLVKSFSTGIGGTPPKDVYSTNCHKKLNRHQIIDGVCLLTYYLGMDGSAGTVDMYKLNQAYILDPSMREMINDLLRDWQCPS